MRRAYALSEEEFCRAEAELELAVSLGLIGQAGFDALEQRRLQKNEENRRKKGCRRSFFTDPAALPDRCICNMS